MYGFCLSSGRNQIRRKKIETDSLWPSCRLQLHVLRLLPAVDPLLPSDCHMSFTQSIPTYKHTSLDKLVGCASTIVAFVYASAVFEIKKRRNALGLSSSKREFKHTLNYESAQLVACILKIRAISVWWVRLDKLWKNPAKLFIFQKLCRPWKKDPNI